MTFQALARSSDCSLRDLNDHEITVYRLSNAPLRALLILGGVLSAGLALGSHAHAEEPAPRAVPQARAFTRAFSSYETLVAYATTIAADQTALDARATTIRVERDGLSADLLASGGSGRGGRLFDPDAQRNAPSHIVSTSSRIADLTALDHQLTAAGALSAPATAWQLPTIGRITQGFGPTPLRLEPARVYEGIAYAHFHEGVDLAGAWAADVVAPARARVVFVGRMSDGAQVVVRTTARRRSVPAMRSPRVRRSARSAAPASSPACISTGPPGEMVSSSIPSPSSATSPVYPCDGSRSRSHLRACSSSP